MPSLIQMTPFERRCKARKIRGLIQCGSPPRPMNEAAEIQQVSRATAYRILEELHAWEETVDFEEEIQDIDKQLRECQAGNKTPLTWNTVGPAKWQLTSGKLTYAYAIGNYQDIAMSEPTIDPMCD